MKRLLIFLLLFISFLIQTAPSTVVIIGHGEKQLKTDSSGNIIYKANHKPEYTRDLSQQGWQRAGALAHFFKLNPYYTAFGNIAAIFAQKPTETSSVRPRDTVKPLADLLHMKVLVPYEKTEYAKLVDLIMTSKKYDGKYVIICFEHHHIPLIAHKFGATMAPTTFPKAFDRVWVLKFDTNGKVVSFEDRPQKLMFGDSEK